jgi:hypothetical protein
MPSGGLKSASGSRPLIRGLLVLSRLLPRLGERNKIDAAESKVAALAGMLDPRNARSLPRLAYIEYQSIALAKAARFSDRRLHSSRRQLAHASRPA